jgi:pyruvate/2-oxoglutarate dehydrogenase complex dihydrolipoamide acyltransferase (E2) component
VVADEADGLVVPTIFDADTKDEAEIAAEWKALEAKALNGSVTAREVAGGTFTVASGFGSEGCDFLPVINAGQAANLGIGSPRGGAIGATVAADARMISGPEAATFLALVQTELRKRTEPE